MKKSRVEENNTTKALSLKIALLEDKIDCLNHLFHYNSLIQQVFTIILSIEKDPKNEINEKKLDQLLRETWKIEKNITTIANSVFKFLKKSPTLFGWLLNGTIFLIFNF